ncbi:MAG: S8 family serine peptidase [Planctomycetes bacterium]|nr:S8 family serine peptidase [Planctomycetota bacterium]MCP4860922.1 S8 family serine peptidase [Planctomycetota bacterium]
MLLLSALVLHALPQQSLAGQLPKEDLGVAAFLEANPDYDGRGIRVAVLDTGVDPGHPFLQKTPDGRRKLVDWYDATTDGRLDTSFTATLDGDGSVIGLSGRRLTFGSHLSSGEVHLGRIGAEFLPGGLQGRIMGDRRSDWQEGADRYQEAVARLTSAGEEIDENSAAEMETKRSWEGFHDAGPVYDVAVWPNGAGWLVVIDADEDGDFGNDTSLSGFRESGEWATLGDEANLNYAVQVSEEGNLTTIFFDTHGHGTHVAGIIGSYEGPDSRLNGIAPGVEIVAIKIGDGKFGGSTYGFAVAKAMDYAVESGCQIANMSFGGPSFYADGNEPDAWVIDEATKRGLILVTSAGNEGPTLTTVGSPGTTESAMSIAAAVWPDTQKVNYGSLNTAPPVLFDFSSRGPLPNGDLGIDFTAPGAALSALPSWTLTKGESWNGTSMAAPQMAGCVALLRGAATAEGLEQSPARIQRALRLSAKRMPQHDWVEVGHGFIDMQGALDHLRNLDKISTAEVEYDISINNPFGIGEGIYLRGLPSSKPFDRAVAITPEFDDDASNAEKSDFLATLRLVSEADWVQVPDAIYTSAAGNRFQARINPATLTPGLYSTRILAYDDAKPEGAGPELVIPVTVVVPMTANEFGEIDNSFTLAQGDLHRTFLQVPLGARHAKLTVTQTGGGRNEFRSGAGSVSGFLYSGDRQARGRFFLGDSDTYETTIPVEPGMVVEYTIASRWSVNSEAKLDLNVRFEGLQSNYATFQVPAGQETGYFAFSSLLRDELGLSASASIDGIAVPVLAGWKIETDPIRATIMGGAGLFQATLDWQLEVPEGTSSVTLYTPRSMQTNEWREDLAIEVYDQAGGVVTRMIVYEDETPLAGIGPGKYNFRLLVPSLGKSALEARFAAAEVRLKGRHGGVSLYPDLDSAIKGSGGLGRLSIPFQGARSLFARMPELDGLEHGRYYFGKVTVKRGTDTIANVPLQVFRPVAEPQMEESHAHAEGEHGEGEHGEHAEGEVATAEGETTAAAETNEKEAAWSEAKANGSENPVQWITSAREWQDDQPLEFRAELAVYEALVAVGLAETARDQAIGFLKRFPNRIAEFRDAAESWN